MTNKHTPAPWHISNNSEDAPRPVAVIYNTPDGYVYVSGGNRNFQTKENWQLQNYTNAQLIAAAPELLEACRLLLLSSDGQCSHDPEVLRARQNMAQAAINKAGGKS